LAWTPPGSIELHNFYEIINASSITVFGVDVCLKNGTSCPGGVAGGNVTSLISGDQYILFSSSTDDITTTINESFLNNTIDDRDSDTTYSAGSNLSLIGTEFSLNTSSLKDWLDTLFHPIWDYDFNDLINVPSYALAIDVWNAISGNRTDIENDIISNWTDLETRKLNITDQRYNETTWVQSQGYLDSDDYINDSELPLENRTIVHCSNITGSASDLCVLVDTDTDTQKTTDDFYLYNDTTTIYFNESQLNNTITLFSNLSFNQSLTDVLYRQLDTEIAWTDLTNYPVACPAGTYLTELGDSVICTFALSSDVYINDSELPLANRTISHCSNITGSTSDLCTVVSYNESFNQSLTDELYTYIAGSNLTLTNKVFSINATSIFNWLSTLFQPLEDQRLSTDDNITFDTMTINEITIPSPDIDFKIKREGFDLCIGTCA